MTARTELSSQMFAELLAQVRRIDVQCRRLSLSMLAGAYRSAFKGSGIEFDEVRAFEEGDDLRAVDWNVTARVGKPYVKRFVEERAQSVYLLLDLEPSLIGGWAAWSLREAAVRIAATLASVAVLNRDQVGLLATTQSREDARETELHHVPLGRSRRHGLRIIRDSLSLPLAPAPSPKTLMITASRVAPPHSLIFLISGFGQADFSRSLSTCAQQHDVVGVRIVPPEIELPRAGLMRLVDPITRRPRVVDSQDSATRSFLADRADAYSQQLKSTFRAANADLLELKLSQSPESAQLIAPLAKYFRGRGLRGGVR